MVTLNYKHSFQTQVVPSRFPPLHSLCSYPCSSLLAGFLQSLHHFPLVCNLYFRYDLFSLDILFQNTNCITSLLKNPSEQPKILKYLEETSSCFTQESGPFVIWPQPTCLVVFLHTCSTPLPLFPPCTQHWLSTQPIFTIMLFLVPGARASFFTLSVELCFLSYCLNAASPEMSP